MRKQLAVGALVSGVTNIIVLMLKQSKAVMVRKVKTARKKSSIVGET